MGKRLQDRVEDLATERYGVGTALSVDREPGGWIVRIWDRRGFVVLNELSSMSRDDALRRMRTALQAKEEVTT